MLLFFLALLVAAAVVGVYCYGRYSAPAQAEHTTALPVSDTLTALDVAVAPLLDQNPGQSGLRLVTDNLHAFALRAAGSRHAERSLDLQYYYWRDDLTGSLLANEVLKAADRGVRVRLLLDDISARAGDRYHLALDTHPNIEVRLFNPTRLRHNALVRGIEMIVRAYSINRRMHHKAWIVDGRVALVGGRNIGDAYFDASEASNFRDMDMMVLGAAVSQAETMFDGYWNSAVSAPVRTLGVSRKGDLQWLRSRLQKMAGREAAQPYLRRVLDENAVRTMLAGSGLIHWTDTARIVSDPPEKVLGGGADHWLIGSIQPVLMAAKQKVEITSPYFIPRADGTRRLLRLVENGVSVSVLTNSLAATDVAAVHGAYARCRQPLVEGGVNLYELRVREARHDMSLFGSRGASLHTKAFVVDGLSCFVGSFNFDPRSIDLNTEMGILFDQAELANEMQAVFAREISSKGSYRVILRNTRIRWLDNAFGNARILDSEPDASPFRRFLAWSIGWLPVESQL